MAVIGHKEKPMQKRIASLALMLVVTSQGAGCGKVIRGSGSGDDTAEVTLALTEAPDDVRCVVITASTDHPDRRRFDVVPGQSTIFPIQRLSPGVVVFDVDAFEAPCATAAAVPNWIGGPMTATLNPGVNDTITIDMHRNSQLTVNVNFDGGVAPTCAGAGWACAADTRCCAGLQCVTDPGNPAAAGKCEPVAPPPMTQTDFVTLHLVGSQHYLLYQSGGDGCQGASATTYLSVPVDTTVCLPPELGDVVAVPVGPSGIQTCAADASGGTCSPCTSAINCGLPSCFKKAAAVPAPCVGTAVKGRAGRNLFVVLRKLAKPDLDNPPLRPDQLPQLLTGSETTDVKLFPPPEMGAFQAVELNTDDLAAAMEGDHCGGGGLCGMIPYRAVTMPVAGFSIVQGGAAALSTSPLF
jgi:hypothetical protein